MSETGGVGAHLGFIFLVVDDMARSLTFYEHLGFKFPPDAFSEPHVEADLPGGGVRIFWNHRDAVKVYAPDYVPVAQGGRVGLAFRLDNVSDVDALFARLLALGHRGDRTPWDMPWGFRYAIVYDPDGNLVELFCPHPES